MNEQFIIKQSYPCEVGEMLTNGTPSYVTTSSAKDVYVRDNNIADEIRLTPFDFEVAKSGEVTVATTEGLLVKILTFNARNDWPIVGLVTMPNGTEQLHSFTEEGLVKGEQHELDLRFMYSVKRCYSIVYKDENGIHPYEKLFNTGVEASQAIRKSKDDREAFVSEVTWYEVWTQ